MVEQRIIDHHRHPTNRNLMRILRHIDPASQFLIHIGEDLVAARWESEGLLSAHIGRGGRLDCRVVDFSTHHEGSA